MQRHLNAFWSGEEQDEETGLSHLYHAGCMLMFLTWTIENMPKLDDRWIDGTTDVSTVFDY